MAQNLNACQRPDPTTRPVAFVLGGGGVRGAVEVGQARALFEAGIFPDMIIGTSIGAINGALIARTPSLDVIEPLTKAWGSDLAKKIYGQSFPRQIANLLRHRNHLLSPEPLHSLLEEHLGTATRFEDLAVPFSTVAASVEGACERWFDTGPVIPAVIASSSVPGILPPAEINGEHLYDGGLVSSIPLGRAIEQGARTIYVLQVGRIEEPLVRPTNVVGSMWVSFEIARRHRFARDLAAVPEGVTVHVLPSGGVPPGGKRNATMPTLVGSQGRMEQAYQRSACFLAESDEVNLVHNPEGDLSVECPHGMTVRGSRILRQQEQP
jgi:NTE family protein